jgi:hypothetical protein
MHQNGSQQIYIIATHHVPRHASSDSYLSIDRRPCQGDSVPTRYRPPILSRSSTTIWARCGELITMHLNAAETLLILLREEQGDQSASSPFLGSRPSPVCNLRAADPRTDTI